MDKGSIFGDTVMHKFKKKNSIFVTLRHADRDRHGPPFVCESY